MSYRVATWVTSSIIEGRCFSCVWYDDLGMIDASYLYGTQPSGSQAGFWSLLLYNQALEYNSLEDFLSFLLNHVSLLFLIYFFIFSSRSLMQKGCLVAFIASKPDYSNSVFSNVPDKHILHPQMPLKTSAGVSYLYQVISEGSFSEKVSHFLYNSMLILCVFCPLIF